MEYFPDTFLLAYCTYFRDLHLCFGILFITVGLFVTGKGWVPPILAVMLHLASSLVIVFNSARLVRFGEELTPMATASPSVSETPEVTGSPAPAM